MPSWRSSEHPPTALQKMTLELANMRLRSALHLAAFELHLLTHVQTSRALKPCTTAASRSIRSSQEMQLQMQVVFHADARQRFSPRLSKLRRGNSTRSCSSERRSNTEWFREECQSANSDTTDQGSLRSLIS
jgi:hypothetical protein